MKDQKPHQLANQLFLKSYRRIASKYAANAFIPNLIADRLFERLQFIKLAPEIILDLGAANVKNSLRLQQEFPLAKVYAVDICEEILSHTKNAIVADAYQLPFANHSVDFIFNNLLLPCLLDYPLLWQELMRVLKPGGLLLFNTLGPDTLTELRQSFAMLDQEPHVNIFLDMHDLGDSLLQAGFSDPVLDVEHYTFTYPHLKQLLKELQALGSTKLIEQANNKYYGKHYWQQLEKFYRQHFSRGNRLQASVEVIFGLAYAPTAKQKKIPGETSVLIESIKHL